jgi:hypothetical protein
MLSLLIQDIESKLLDFLLNELKGQTLIPMFDGILILKDENTSTRD